MAYENAGLRCLLNAGSQSIWVLRTADAVGTSGAAGYITNAGPNTSTLAAGRGMKLGDMVIIQVYSAGTAEVPTAFSDGGLYYVSAISATTGAATLVAFGAT